MTNETIDAPNEKLRTLTEEEVTAITGDMTVYVNVAFCIPMGTNLRLSFGEKVGARPVNIVGTYLVDISTATELRNLLEAQLEKVVAQQQANALPQLNS